MQHATMSRGDTSPGAKWHAGLVLFSGELDGASCCVVRNEVVIQSVGAPGYLLGRRDRPSGTMRICGS